jgi:hypothetical protein
MSTTQAPGVRGAVPAQGTVSSRATLRPDGQPAPAVPLLAGLRPMIAYAAARVVGLAMLAVFAHRAGRSVLGLLTAWDGTWYIGLAQHGYDTSVRYQAGRLVNTNIAFLPLFSWLIKAVSVVGVPADWAAVIVANLAGLAAAWAIGLIGTRLYDRRVGIVLAVLWGALPHAVVESMAYTESLFTALAAWALWALLERRYLLAGSLTALAGLTRPTATALIAAVGIGCLVVIVRQVRGVGWRRAWSDGGWRPWVGAALSPLGLAGFLVWCAVALHRVDAYFWMQDQGWGTTVDLGRTTVHEFGVTLTHERPLALAMTSLVLVLAVLLCAVLAVDVWRARAATLVPLLVFCGVLLLTVLVQGGVYYYAKARFLLPAFGLLLPVATALASTRAHVRYAVLALLVLISGWYGAYLTITWYLSP